MTYLIPQKNSLSATHNGSDYFVNYYCSLISTTATDDIYTNWDSTTQWKKDEYVIVPELKRIYRCSAPTSQDEYPPANPKVWTDYGANNAYKMFDDIIGSQTEFTNTMTIEIDSNQLNSLAFLNLESITGIQVVQTDENTQQVFYDKTISLIDYGVLSLYDYWYKPVKVRKSLILFDLYYFTNSKVTVTFTANGIGKVGAMVCGLADNIGITLADSRVKLKDYSKYVVDDYGSTSFSKRGYARIITAQAIIDRNIIDDTASKLVELRGTLTLFVGDEDADGYEMLTTIGYIQDLEFTLSRDSKSTYPITIIGVT